MFAPPGNDRVPKVITIRVFKAEGLQVIPKSEKKAKKYIPKWKVVFIGGKSKMSSDSILAPSGNPVWNYEVTLKLASKSEPMLILITDADDHHVGQVVIPLIAMSPRPLNANERPTDPSRMRVAELEPTKKVSTPFGKIFFWLWVEEYRSIESSGKSSKVGGSLISLSNGGRKHKKDRMTTTGSVADSLNYNGSVLSLESSQMGVSDKKKPWYKRKLHKSGSRSSVSVAQRPASVSMFNVYDPSRNPGAGQYRPPQSSLAGMPYSYDDNDGSILGANSDMTTSDLYNSGMPGHSPASSVGGGSRTGGSVISNPARMSLANHPDLAAMRNELLRASPVPPIKQPLEPFHSTVKPSLVSCSPSSCPTTGGVKVTIECVNLSEEMIRHAALLVDGYTVPRQDWFYKETGGDHRSELCVHMPERPTGQCWIELETMSYGRVRCPQRFSYLAAAPAPQMSVSDGRPNGQATDSYSSSSPEASDSDEDRQLDRDTLSTVLQSPQSKQPQAVPSNGGGPMKPLAQEQPMAPADSGLGSPLPANNWNPFTSDTKPTARSAAAAPKEPSDEEDTGYNPLLAPPAHKKTSVRSNASNLSAMKNPLDESFKLENDGLRAMMKEANDTITLVKKQNTDLEQKLAVQTVEVDRLSKELCSLRNRLLQDGLVQYLEK